MFVARIAGQSMEPKIPDGSLCVFRHGVTGSRQGRLVLVERLGGGVQRPLYRQALSQREEAQRGWDLVAREDHARIAESGV